MDNLAALRAEPLARAPLDVDRLRGPTLPKPPSRLKPRLLALLRWRPGRRVSRGACCG